MSFSIHSSVVSGNFEELYRYLQDNRLLHKLPNILSEITIPDSESSKRVPIEVVSNNIRIIEKHLDEPCLGLKLIANRDVPDNLIFNPDTHFIATNKIDQRLNSVVIARMIERYFRILTEVVSVSCDISKHTISFNISPNSTNVTHHQTDGVLVAIYRMFDARANAKLLKLELTQNKPHKDATSYNDVFQIEPHFGAKQNQLVFENELQGNECEIDYTQLISMNEHLLGQNFPNQKFSERCKHIIKQLLPLGEPTRDNVGKVLNMSVSTLKRKLKTEELTFKELVNDVRYSLANEYVIKGKMNFTDAAFQLGYKDIPQFSKAFKKFYGQSPTEYFANSKINEQ